MLKDVGMEVLKSIETRSKFISLHLEILYGILYGVTHVMIVACYHLLPLSACMLNFDLVSILFSTSIPTSFNILVKMFL